MQKILIIISLVLLCTGCSWFKFPGVYKIDVQQGNIITQEMVDQLKPGMSQRQVQFIMGTPLVKDSFNQDRWDYLYSVQPGGKERTQERLTLFFSDDRLSHFSGDFVPGSAAQVTDSKEDSATTENESSETE